MSSNKYKVRVEREITIIRTEKADVIVDLDDDFERCVEDVAMDMVEEDYQNQDKGINWWLVDEEEDSGDYKVDILSIEELPPDPPVEDPRQVK